VGQQAHGNSLAVVAQPPFRAASVSDRLDWRLQLTIQKPRGPRNLPILGSLPSFRARPIEFLCETARKYGDLPYFRLGSYHAYLINHPDFVRDILVTNQSNFTKSRALQRARILFGEGLLTSEGKFHLRQRRLVQPAFHRDRLAGYATVMSDCAMRVRERWQSGSTLEMSDEMMRLTLAVVGKTLFSADVESEAPEIGEALTTVLKMFRMLMMPFSEYLEKLPLPSIRRFEKARDRLDRTIYGLIRERRKSGGYGRPALHAFVGARRRSRWRGYDGHAGAR